MTQSVTTKIRGLFTSDNDLGSVPEGALLKAKNIVIDKADIAEPRRGFDRLSAGYGAPTDRSQRLWFYKDTLYTHVDSATDYVAYWNGSAWVTVGSFDAPSGGKVYTAEANQNLYFTTSTGVRKLDSVGGTVRMSGAFKGLDIRATASTSTPTWLGISFRTAYRVIWGYKDANNSLILGAPSSREEFKNTADSARSVSISVTMPIGVTTAWFVQVYRASSVSDAAATEVLPNDEMQLVYEANPTSDEITAGLMTIADITPDDLRGAALYTNASQEGLVNGNEQPPLTKDIAVFKGHTFYANTTSKHRYYLTLLSVGGTNGIAADDTLTIGGIVYTAKASETIASGQFMVTTSGSSAQNIRDTAVSICRVINRYSSSTVYAFYLSGPSDLPGKILFEERSIGGASFAVLSSRATCWSPDLQTSGTAESSTNDQFKNGLFFSKSLQPESVPLPNFFAVGSKDEEIRRIVPLRDSLFVFKDDGIYRITGENSTSFSVTLLDSSAKLLAPESAAVLNNQIYGLSDQGVITVSETGVSIISRAIEQDLLSLLGASLDNVKTLSWGVSYESERKYALFTITGAGDTYATQAYVWNTFTNSWVRWTLAKRCGAVSPADDKLYLGDALSHFVNPERKSRTFTDQVDYGFATTLSVASGFSATVASGADLIEVGDLIYQSASVFSIVSSVDAVTGVIGLLVDGGLVPGAVDVLKAIPTEIEWAPVTFGNPAAIKQINTAIYLFRAGFTGRGTGTFKSDLSLAENTVTFAGSGLSAWGLFSWDSVPWGGDAVKRPIRTWIPRDKQVCSQITVGFRHQTAYAGWQLAGISLVGEFGGEKVAR